LRKGESDQPQPVEFLQLEVDDALREEVAKAEKEFDAHIAKHDLRVGTYRRYGKDAIKKCGVSPDAWFDIFFSQSRTLSDVEKRAQMAMQLAYALTYGYNVPTYESAQVRRFALGRTETVRVCTPQSVAWYFVDVESSRKLQKFDDSFCDRTKSMLDDSYSPEERRRLFREAVKQHGLDMKAASNGLGIDRHLFGSFSTVFMFRAAFSFH
jgi:carnitine O-acetyltransferase